MLQIYLAGRITQQEELRAVRWHIESLGHTVKSSWLDEEDANYPVERFRAMTTGSVDLREVRACDIFIIDTRVESNTGGREVEYGVAIESRVTVWRVGPVRNIFHEFATEFKDWTECLTALENGQV